MSEELGRMKSGKMILNGVNKKRHTPISSLLTPLFLLLVLCSLPLFAQEAEELSTYRIDNDGNLIQTLRWTRANAYYYEVEIEKEDGPDNWVSHHKERTEETAVEVILTPGMYRWRVLNYNVLGRVAARSEWESLRIYPALDPAITAFDPPALFVDARLEEFTLTVTGRNFTGETKVHLTAKSGRTRPWEPLSTERSENNETVRAVFPVYQDITLGEYDVVITNPGGLGTATGGFQVTFERPIDYAVSLAFSPVIPVSGTFFNEYDQGFYPPGFSGRFAMVPFKRLWGSIGGEASVRFVDLTTKDERFTLNGQLLVFSANALYQRWFRDYTMNAAFRLGAGFAPLLNMRFDHENGVQSEQFTPTHAALGFGGSWQWYVWQELYVEAGLDYTQLLGRAPAGLLSFTVGAGWRFGRKGAGGKSREQ